VHRVPPRVRDLIENPHHWGLLEGATWRGRAEFEGIVHVGLWLDRDGRVQRARFRSTSCPALIAYAEAACANAEATRASRAPEVEEIVASVSGVHPIHHGRAQTVALAFSRAFPSPSQLTAEQERA
jgi:hypothetical protein